MDGNDLREGHTGTTSVDNLAHVGRYRRKGADALHSCANSVNCQQLLKTTTTRFLLFDCETSSISYCSAHV